MVITCPSCGRRFSLERRPPETFHCPKCSFTVPFSVVLNGGDNKSENDSSMNTQDGQVEIPVSPGNDGNKTKVVPVTTSDGHTQVVSGLQMGGKTSVVPSLQARQMKAVFQLSFRGMQYGTIVLPSGNFEVGRKSSDSRAKVRLTPDMSMSRIHAGMRTVKINGHVVYQITSVKNENPVYVNQMPIPKGKACNLKNGDQIMMGETIIIFRIM